MDKNNQQNYFSNPVVIVLVIILVGLGGYLLFSKNSNVSDNKVSDLSNIPTNQDTNTNTQIPVVEPKPAPQVNQNTGTKKIATPEESRYCAQQSKALFDYHYNNVTSNGAYPIKGSLTYENHLNAKQGKCFMLEMSYIEPGALGAGSGKGLYDVYDNKSIAHWDDIGSPYSCEINGVYGCTKAQFSAFLNSEMESTTY